MWIMFESSVNSEGIETRSSAASAYSMFESSVNSEGIETELTNTLAHESFESSVNSEGIETHSKAYFIFPSLRAV